MLGGRKARPRSLSTLASGALRAEGSARKAAQSLPHDQRSGEEPQVASPPDRPGSLTTIKSPGSLAFSSVAFSPGKPGLSWKPKERSLRT